MFLCWPRKNCYSLAGKFWFICRIHQTLHLQIYIYSGLYKINGKFINSLEDCERHLKQFFAQKDKVLGGWNYEVAWKMAEGRGTKQWIHCSAKFLVKKKSMSFILTLKLKELFGQRNTSFSSNGWWYYIQKFVACFVLLNSILWVLWMFSHIVKAIWNILCFVIILL